MQRKNNMNNDIRNGWGGLIGFKCHRCCGVFSYMWGTICNKCRNDEEKYQEILKAITAQKEG